MPTVGEELVGEYLKLRRGCDFVQYNLRPVEGNAEIDVVGIDVKNKVLYVCEVAIHTAGLQYTANGKVVNVEKLTRKFDSDIEYARCYFPDHETKPMLWSAIVKQSKPTSKRCQTRDVEAISEHVRAKHGVELEVVANRDFLDALRELRQEAGLRTSQMDGIMRLMQIEEKVAKHVGG